MLRLIEGVFADGRAGRIFFLSDLNFGFDEFPQVPFWQVRALCRSTLPHKLKRSAID
jgi:hypothetical protein